MIAVPAWGWFPPRLIWNASASVPVGFNDRQVASGLTSPTTGVT